MTAPAPRPVPREIEALARSIEWLAVAQMLVLFHGQDRAWKWLQELGCPLVGNQLATPGEDGNLSWQPQEQP